MESIHELQDGPSFDQWRAFVAVVDTGSFSAAGRRLGRVQSAISHAIAALEEHLGVPLFDREPRTPVLTDAGRALLPDARRVLADAAAICARARAFAGGEEPRVVAVVDALFPLEALVHAARVFRETRPTTELVLRTETLSVVTIAVEKGEADVGVAGGAGLMRGLVGRPLGSVRMLPCVARDHPLATLHTERSGDHGVDEPHRGLTPAQLASEIQIVLSERGHGQGDGTPDQGVLSRRTWRVVDLETKEALIRGGLGWGNLPENRLRRCDNLVPLKVAPWTDDTFTLSFMSVRRPHDVQGPATRAFVAALEQACEVLPGVAGPPASSSSPSSPSSPSSSSSSSSSSSPEAAPPARQDGRPAAGPRRQQR